MGFKRMATEMDREEIAYQMAYDLADADEAEARRRGVSSPSAIQAAGRCISARDPDWFKNLEKWTG